MAFLPISINVSGKKIVLVGGGRIAWHKIGFLLQFTDNLSVVAMEVCDEIKRAGVRWQEKTYESGDLRGALLVYACTNLKNLNQQIKSDAEGLGILCNVVDNPSLCDFVSPAIYKQGIYTVACGSDGKDVYKSIAIRNKIKDFLENDPTIFTSKEHSRG